MRLSDYPRRRASTQFLQVPLSDWPAVTAGRKTELRSVGRNATHHRTLIAPAPIVCWAVRRYKRDAETALMVLEATWSEPLGAISPESLAREGFETFAEFRTYWRSRQYGKHGPFKPLSTVQVYRLRPWHWDDDREMGAELLHHLYGHWLGTDA